MQNLPLLPGYNFNDPTKNRYHRCQTLGYRNGFAIPKQPRFKIGGETLLDYNVLNESELDLLMNYNPVLTYGQAKECPPSAFQPSFVELDKKVLGFKCWFKETIYECPTESYRVRFLNLYYYLEDDSISVEEEKSVNSGFPQGTFISRRQIPKNDAGGIWTWNDLNVGTNVNLFGKVMHIYDYNASTRDWLESQGIEVRCPECPPKDPYTEMRRCLEMRPADPDPCIAKECIKLCKFLKNDRKVLRFYGIWDDNDQFHKHLRTVVLQFYLSDDTMDVKEIHHQNDGRDLFPFIVSRHKIPKDRSDVHPDFNWGTLELSEMEVKEYFSPKDFGIGKTVQVYNRPILLYNCDDFTKAYYWKNFGITDFTPADISVRYPTLRTKDIPPWNLHGTLDDSMQNVYSIPNAPKKDYGKMLNYQGVVLRYLMTLHNPTPIESCRRFVLSYSLSGDLVNVYETEQPNSGFIGGTFLARSRIRKPSSSVDEPEFYGPNDFKIGSVIEIYSRKFRIIDADKYVLKFMTEYPDQFDRKW
ncbi:hypothetical protein HELRODRAFT_65269 [Helobdella robusta]|uniref:DM10 domain-containing protein n=1 Tax=Helobdella robusta TaxID=6412 RepID=T1FY52_HELRO|nr:hypothetical protein HELRODRAFT_65269 [Helobdella robusta]ESO02389.1 hypothetical protein HELRODRAFT_65269 [Helobdella robusta]